jgi:hypothetical protein
MTSSELQPISSANYPIALPSFGFGFPQPEAQFWRITFCEKSVHVLQYVAGLGDIAMTKPKSSQRL